MTNPLRPRIRKLAPKTRTGCKTCKKRRVKCGEERPICARCLRLNLTCEGYEIPKPWLFEPRSSSSQSPTNVEEISNSDQSSGTIEHDTQDTQQEVSTTATPSQALSRIHPLIPIKDSEDLVLMRLYVRFAANCPVAWESDLYSNKRAPGAMTDLDVSRMHLNSPVTKVAHLAMATATLHLFQPETFPFQLQLKYLQLAIVEVRKRIVKRSFEISDLLHGISQIFLASVLIGDEIAARAHLKAAKDLVDEKGGMQAVCPPTVHALQYGDLHLAVETVSAPVFMSIPSPELHYHANDISVIDPTVLRLTGKLRHSALRESLFLSQPLVRCLCNFAECAIALSDAWSDPPSRFDLTKLNFIASNMMGVFSLLLKLSCSKKTMLTTLQEDTRHTLVLWIQLLCFMGNSTVTHACVRDNTIEISSSVLSHHVSLSVRHGLMRWNHVVASSKRDPHGRDEKANDDLLELIHVVEDMEEQQCIRVAPLMLRLWELRRSYRGAKLQGRAAKEAFQHLDSSKFHESDVYDDHSVDRSRSSSTVA